MKVAVGETLQKGPKKAGSTKRCQETDKKGGEIGSYTGVVI